jgi:hypothetical protein
LNIAEEYVEIAEEHDEGEGEEEVHP